MTLSLKFESLYKACKRTLVFETLNCDEISYSVFTELPFKNRIFVFKTPARNMAKGVSCHPPPPPPFGHIILKSFH